MAIVARGRITTPAIKDLFRSLLSASDWDAIGQAATSAIQTQWDEFIRESSKAVELR
jgi:hypothetical protein